MERKKKVLIVCPCSLRGNSIGLIEEFLTQFDSLKKDYCDIDLFDTNFNEDHIPEKYKVNKYYGLKIGVIQKLIRKIPGFRAKYAQKRVLSEFKKILCTIHYDLVIFYKVPSYSDQLISICHKSGAKTVLFPWGSEVLRANQEDEKHLRRAYGNTDFVAGYENSNLILKARNIYKVPQEKIKEQKIFFKGIKYLAEADLTLSRKEMSSLVGVPVSGYNIICGYSGCRPQRHIEIIEAIYKIKKDLPDDYQLVFPVTYVAEKGYIEELRYLCDNYKLNSVFITKYLSDVQMAYLHLISDLYINVQPSDAGSAFMIEALFAKNQILVGEWLKYVQFEQFGKPYYVLDDLKNLPKFLSDIFMGKLKKAVVPEELIAHYVSGKDFDKGQYWKTLIEQNIVYDN